MTLDLFSSEERFTPVLMPEADVSFLRELHTGMPDDRIVRELLEDTPWRQETVVVWGKRHLQPRLIAWYGNKGKAYSYSGISMSPLPWTNLLLHLKRNVEERAQTTFNSVLLNLYRNQNDSMGFHSDDERELGPEPTIASLSYGAERTLVFKHKRDKTVQDFRLALPNGSMLLMKGPTQRNWKHGILKQGRSCGPRVNLTFRNIMAG